MTDRYEIQDKPRPRIHPGAVFEELRAVCQRMHRADTTQMVGGATSDALWSDAAGLVWEAVVLAGRALAADPPDARAEAIAARNDARRMEVV